MTYSGGLPNDMTYSGGLPEKADEEGYLNRLHIIRGGRHMTCSGGLPHPPVLSLVCGFLFRWAGRNSSFSPPIWALFSGLVSRNSPIWGGAGVFQRVTTACIEDAAARPENDGAKFEEGLFCFWREKRLRWTFVSRGRSDGLLFRWSEVLRGRSAGSLAY